MGTMAIGYNNLNPFLLCYWIRVGFLRVSPLKPKWTFPSFKVVSLGVDPNPNEFQMNPLISSSFSLLAGDEGDALGTCRKVATFDCTTEKRRGGT